MDCKDTSKQMIEKFKDERKKVSPQTANKEIIYLKATFNYGISENLISNNPAEGIKFFPTDKKSKYVPIDENIDKVIESADTDTQEYLHVIRETTARVNEINNLTWSDVDFAHKFVVLFTRKKKGGHRTPRKVPMTERLFEILTRRYENRDQTKPWVFWHSYWSSKSKQMVCGPYNYRSKIMGSLCEKAKVKDFRFHAFRHSGASFLESNNVLLKR